MSRGIAGSPEGVIFNLSSLYFFVEVRMSNGFIPAVVAPKEEKNPSYWFLIRQDRVLVSLLQDGPQEKAEIPLLVHPDRIGVEVGEVHYLGSLNGRGIYAAAVKEGAGPPPELTYKSPRSLLVRLEEEMLSLAGRALQIVDWGQTHKFCGKCGRPTGNHPRERAKICPVCGLESYPVISPAVIVAVSRGEELLLARSPRFPESMFSVLAGFNEPGESLEETVEREIMEEVGLKVANISYFGSQPWPFPHSLMIGFTADYAGGRIRVDGEEIIEAGWYKAGRMPNLPGRYSIARELIEDFLASHPGPGF